jgi:amino acid transporter
MVISIKLPRVTLGAVSNVVGVLGLVAIAVAVGGLTGNWWWTALVAGVFAVGLAYLAGVQAEADAKPDLKPVRRAS